MVMYICDYCGMEFVIEEEYHKHIDNCPESPWNPTKSIDGWLCILKINLDSLETSYTTYCKTIFDKEDRYSEWIKESEDFQYEKLFAKKDELEKVLRKLQYRNVVELQYKTLKLPIFEFIKPLFEEEIKNIIQEQIDKLVETKNKINIKNEK